MLGNNNTKDGKYVIFRVVLLDVIVLSIWIWLVGAHAIPLYPTAAIVCPTLFIADFLIIKRAFSRLTATATSDVPTHNALWRLAAIYTIACIVAILYWIKKPSAQSAFQVGIGIIVTVFFWYLVHRKKSLTAPRKVRIKMVRERVSVPFRFQEKRGRIRSWVESGGREKGVTEGEGRRGSGTLFRTFQE